MKKALTKKVVSCLLIVMVMLALLQGFSFAKSENIQMIKKCEDEYMIYVSNLLDKEFEFAFSNITDVDKTALVFNDSALDQIENGNSIAYVDSILYEQYFKDKDSTYLWVKQGTEYILEAQKVELLDALTEEDIQTFNQVTKIIEVTVGEKQLPTETEDGVEISHKIDTLDINDKTGSYSYKMVKAIEGSDEAKLIALAVQMNSLDDKDMFEKLSVYSEFKAIYNKLQPEVNDTKWIEVKDCTIEQPQESKKGDQYLVWIKKDNSTIDLQIMTCADTYTPEYEKQETVIKETTKLPITGDSIVLFVIAGVILVLIIAVVVLKFKKSKVNEE